jgi:hypothetical protein
MSTPADMIALLEYAHPHIALRIKTLWGLPECGEYVTKLMLPTRLNREGFDEPTVQSLIALQELHAKLYPTHHDVWEAA